MPRGISSPLRRGRMARLSAGGAGTSQHPGRRRNVGNGRASTRSAAPICRRACPLPSQPPHPTPPLPRTRARPTRCPARAAAQSVALRYTRGNRRAAQTCSCRGAPRAARAPAQPPAHASADAAAAARRARRSRAMGRPRPTSPPQPSYDETVGLVRHSSGICAVGLLSLVILAALTVPPAARVPGGAERLRQGSDARGQRHVGDGKVGTPGSQTVAAGDFAQALHFFFFFLLSVCSLRC